MSADSLTARPLGRHRRRFQVAAKTLAHCRQQLVCILGVAAIPNCMHESANTARRTHASATRNKRTSAGDTTMRAGGASVCTRAHKCGLALQE
jgi:hypothetical protein